MGRDIDINLNKYIGTNIRKFREYRNLTVNELASKVNAAEGSIRNIECGRSLSLPLLIRISVALEIQIDSLLYDYVYHIPESKSNNKAVELFIETYNSVSDREKRIIEHLLSAFNKDYPTNQNE